MEFASTHSAELLIGNSSGPPVVREEPTRMK